MMLIGTSLGACINSIVNGEVSEDDVLMVITRTECPDLTSMLRVAEQYYFEGNKYSTYNRNYTFDKEKVNIDEVKELVSRLYLSGKIHQPRLYEHGSGFIHPDMSRDNIWLEVNPIGVNDNPLVIDAYEKYKMLDALTK